ncbi:hypothetical protein EDB80DRAFT_272466 [Ilyonectria destructans]|nr:hypothetical protein EDB80DRAFT_272466 [Ilyonectria destructans]
MPDSAPGHAARPEDAQCYNCGASGHWAIACPEPTRETPAGLAAWRSTNNIGKGGNNRDQHGGSKKSKGPIITKYAPPPPPGPTVNRYGPPPGYGQPPGPYPGSAPPYPPQYPPHSAPIPNYAPSYPPQSYPPQPYPPPSYGNTPLSALPPGPPPGPYGLPPHPHLPPHPSHPPPHPSHPSHQQRPPHPPHPPHQPHPPHPAGPPPSYPPAYGPPPTTQPPQQYGSQPPYGSSYPQPYSYGSHPQPSYPPSYTPPPAPPTYGLAPVPRPGPPPGPSSRPLSGSPPLSRHGPPSISTLPVPGRSHPSLPPRPPQSNRNVHEPPRDHRNKKKHERHNRNRDNRQKKPPSHPRPPDQKAAARNHRIDYKAPDASKPPASPLPHEQSPHKTPPKTIPETPKIPEIPELPKIPEILEVPEIPEIPVTAPGQKSYDAAEPQAEPSTKVDEPAKDPSETEEGEWDQRAVPKEPEATHIPDEAVRPLPANHSPQVLLPRNRDANSTESKFVKPDDLEEYTKPIHEKPDWTSIQLDPVAQDGKPPGGDPLPKVPIGDTQVDRSSSESGDVNEQRRKHGHSRDHTPEERPSKRQRSNSPPNHSPESSRDYDIPEKLRDSFRPRSRKVHRSDDSDKRSTDVPTTTHRRTPDRMQSYEREPSRSRSPSSRRSSVSNASSGLDSLEAELLGRPDKAKSPEDINKRRQSSGNSNKPKKRQPRLDSAYSRRW